MKHIRHFYLLFFVAFLVFGIMFFGVMIEAGDSGLIFLAPVLFTGIGIVFGVMYFKSINRIRVIMKKGRKFRGKIYQHLEDQQYSINGQGTIVLDVRYFDENGYKKRAKVPVGTVSPVMYPEGASVTVAILGDDGYADPMSVGYEPLYQEEILMSDKPMDDEGRINLKEEHCENCGAVVYEPEGFIYKCPYCGSYGNVKYEFVESELVN